MRTDRSICFSFVIALSLAFVGQSLAVEVTLNIDSLQSSLAADLYVVAVDATAAAQDPPMNTSLTTTYSGTITVDVDDLLNPTSIRFVSANAVAADSGVWLPDSNGGDEGDENIDGDANPGMAEPANYGWNLDLGAVGTVLAASRDTVFDIRSLSRSVAGGSFDPLGLFVKPQGTFDGNVSSAAFGDGANSDSIETEKGINCTDITGIPDTCVGLPGDYSVVGNVATLTLPLNFVIGAAHGVTDFNGDGFIDGRDYTVWRDNLGSNDPLIDADGSGVVDIGDFNLWVLEFGEEVDDDDGFLATFTGEFVATVTLPPSAVPEPNSATMVFVALTALGWIARRKSATTAG